VNQVKANPNIPMISPGDTVKVSFRVKEANRERLQTLPGLVVKVRKGVGGGNFTIRRVASAIGVEHTFPFASPLLEKVEVVRHGKVRRAKLYYIRRLSAREARLKERRDFSYGIVFRKYPFAYGFWTLSILYSFLGDVRPQLDLQCIVLEPLPGINCLSEMTVIQSRRFEAGKLF
jgi:large subunit ribosomal protein L19